MEFHISRKARDKYQFDQSLYQFSGNVIFSDFYTVRQFAQKINEKKDLLLYPEQAVKASQINALGLIDEILHIVFALYREQKAPDVTDKALKHLQNKLGNEQIEAILKSFLVEFPPLSVYKKEMNMEQYLASSTDGISNRANTLEEIIMLWLSNKNPAFTPYNELFSDETLQNRSKYLQFMAELQSFFDTQPFFGPGNLQLIDMLQSPALAAPYSLQGQLDYIRMHWADLLGRHLFRLLTGLDLIKEEEKLHLPGPGEIPVPTYQSGLDDEAERFSEDREWMPRLVLVAKNTHVWLDQLSKKYQKKISRLDEIPDEELDILARRGFTGLWLIGIWERSRASARIKQLCGNPEAIASAYSLMSYHIAADLGGESSYNDLQKRSWQKGIRMASDMVPNHMGIDSDWVADRPDWFLSLDYCPFPAYSFNGENLSSHDNCSIFIEDHYFDRTDAAVVFKHIDHSSNRTRFIYHGNDGTSMPWNDTAQLNYLNPEVREAVIQTIIKVAKKFPIIRFDAAMTLTKRHYQRLWFPEPGSGGDIPTRAENGMSKAQFDEKIPVEFWREVVERITSEVPDTLLLAEAFWLMESYFVRSLGMHRVYNSAFMNLLRDEDNARYRMVMKNTLEFDPEILKRYVNFMNNPDERTAVDQFGKDDKYFGICTLMCTLPGLPMFGHGQIEGFSEKYGMEYRRSYWDEQPDEWLLKRHEKEIFPLLHRRALFAEVANFLLYDFYTVDGIVNEDVFAYSNRSGNERALVVYQNRFASTQGWIRTSVGFSQKSADGERNIVESTLDKGLNIHPNEHSYLLFRDVITGLEYIRSTIEVCNQGLFFNLNAYQHHVFVDFRVVHDVDNSYKDICEYLNGQGVPDIHESMNDYVLRYVQNPFKQIANSGYFNYLLEFRYKSIYEKMIPVQVLDEACEKLKSLLDGVEKHQNISCSHKQTIIQEFRREFKFIATLSPDIPSLNRSETIREELQTLEQNFRENENDWLTAAIYLFVRQIGKISVSTGDPSLSLSRFDEWHFGKIIANAFSDMGFSEDQSWQIVETIRLLVIHHNWFNKYWKLPLNQIFEKWTLEDTSRRFLRINRYQGILWFDRDAGEDFLKWMKNIVILQAMTDVKMSPVNITEQILGARSIYQRMHLSLEKSGFKLHQLITELTTEES